MMLLGVVPNLILFCQHPGIPKRFCQTVEMQVLMFFHAPGWLPQTCFRGWLTVVIKICHGEAVINHWPIFCTQTPVFVEKNEASP